MDARSPAFRSQRMGKLAMTRPGATAVLRDYGLDFCCSGDAPLEEAAAARGLDVEPIERDLAERTSTARSAVPQGTSALIDHIVSRYHEVHRVDLLELRHLARKVEEVHAEDPTAPSGLHATLTELDSALEEHMAHEEIVFFPAMREGGPVAPEVIDRLREEHDDHGRYWQELKTCTNSFTPPAHACATWTALYDALAKFVVDLMEHVHLENNVLFPRFELAATRATA